MRLLTHNMMQCHVKGCTSNNFPLRLEEVELEQIEAEFNPEFIARLLPKIDYPALVATTFSLGIDLLPQNPPADDVSEEFLRRLHQVLLEIRVKEGRMVCNGCGHVFPIKDTVPNMLLQDNEV
ncbi:uncharacterized protein BJ171DRAFT_196133 [Polychytrium aggregatum]|uniref:uncharacterized protein n=1 Tax=Polychytrium aggregatum TaxID=110093 RepID=UPI0022FDFABC|nr:uncharacterized protein BJ171DRAFT_196133 [Polychytrium aggregatum]KAI9201822.1 hypothetical protein BJ171DRAFT_196133 [Polychytrium aggregatum]